MEQRVIKFRAWDGEQMINPPDGYMFESTVIGNDFPGGITVNKMGRKKIELMQYTGYQDFYEGDVVESANGKQWIIAWRDFGWWIDNKNIVERGRNKMAGDESYSLIYYISLCEQSGAKFVLKKVGNIYENPEFVLITHPTK